MTTPSDQWWDDERELADHEKQETYITPATRLICYRRDNYKCRKCGEEEGLTLHHVIYRSLGGGHKADNLITLCWGCHRRVHDKQIIPMWINGTWIFRDVKGWRWKALHRRRFRYG